VIRLASVCSFLLSVFTGCGYSFQGSSTILPSSVRKVFVAQVKNNSTDARLGVLVTEALRDRFDRGGVITLVDSIDDADAVLTASIKRVDGGAVTSTSTTNQALQVNNALVLSAELRRLNGQILWNNPSLVVNRYSAATRSAVQTSTGDFASTGLLASDVVGLNDREVARSQQQSVYGPLVDEAARRVFEESVGPDF
jgi:hypothetical protein